MKTIFFAGLFLVIFLADILGEDKLFSQFENRALASKPDFSVEAFLDGSFSEGYENYVTDQFLGRNTWIFVKTLTDVALGKTEINGVYLGEDGYLLEQHTEKDFPLDAREKKKQWLVELARKNAGEVGNFHVMLVPTADVILKDKLPKHAESFDQLGYWQEIERALRGIENQKTENPEAENPEAESSVTGKQEQENRMIPVPAVLDAHRDEYIYYKTDHHWTTWGAYLAYREWAKAVDVTPVEYEAEVVSRDFFGTLHSKINLPMKEGDVLEAYHYPGVVQVYYDFATEPVASLYEEKYLDTKNQYAYFLDENHAFIQIDVANSGNGKSLFIIKDSYANCMIPFLANHYETIYIVDLRYYKGSLEKLMETHVSEDTDVLVLHNLVHFVK